MADDGVSGGSAGYYGQLGLNDDGSQFNVLAAIIAGALGRARTMVLVKVVAVTNDGGVAAVGFVDVLPLVKQADGVGNVTSHGTVFNLPYFRLQGGANAVIMDPKEGDLGIAVVADRDSSAAKSTKAEAAPGSKRRFSLADGVYVGGILNGEPEQYVRFTDDGMTIADKNGNVLSMQSGKIAATTTVFEIDGALHVTGQSTFDAALSGTSATFSGALAAASAAISGAVTAASTAISGALSAVGATFSGALSAASASIVGAFSGGGVSAASGTISGVTDINVTGHSNYLSHHHGNVATGGAVTGGPS